MAKAIAAGGGGSTSPVELEVVIEIPRWSFLKRGSTGRVDFVSPVPCPFNYGSVRGYIGGDEDFLDAIVLGPRLPRGARVSVRVHGAIGLTDRDMYDDKLVCSRGPLKARDRRLALLYMNLYGWLKRALNRWRGRPGRTACEGWQDARGAIARARPCEEGAGARPAVPF